MFVSDQVLGKPSVACEDRAKARIRRSRGQAIVGATGVSQLDVHSLAAKVDYGDGALASALRDCVLALAYAGTAARVGALASIGGRAWRCVLLGAPVALICEYRILMLARQ